MTTNEVNGLPAKWREMVNIEYHICADELESALASAPAGEAVAWCALTEDGRIAYFDGKPVFMPGKEGNICHPTPLYTRPTPAADASEAVPEGWRGRIETVANNLGEALEGCDDRASAVAAITPYIDELFALAAAPPPQARIRHSCETDMLSECPACDADMGEERTECEVAVAPGITLGPGVKIATIVDCIRSRAGHGPFRFNRKLASLAAAPAESGRDAHWFCEKHGCACTNLQGHECAAFKCALKGEGE